MCASLCPFPTAAQLKLRPTTVCIFLLPHSRVSARAHVRVRLSVANYPCYKYKIPIRHCVSGWLQRRHNWFQMVTQVLFAHCKRLCVSVSVCACVRERVREAAGGEPVRTEKEEGGGRGAREKR